MNTITTKNYTLKLEHDELAESPREWDNLGKMICFHKRYTLGDDHDYRPEDYSGWDEMQTAIIKNEDAAIILPIYMYDHSGITISTSPFSCPWDSGRIGFICISKKKIREEYSVKRITKKLIDRVTEYLKGEVETYDQYLRGDVYCFTVTNNETGEEEDSCGGFFGDDIKTNGVLDNLSEEIRTEILAEMDK